MLQTLTEKITAPRYSAVLLGCAALLIASAAQAQVERPGNTVYLTLKGGATVYGGERDQTGGVGDFLDDGINNDSNGSDVSWLFDDFGWGVGGGLGYQFTPNLGFDVQFLYGNYINLDEPATRAEALQQFTGGVFDENARQDVEVGVDEALPSVAAKFRYMPFPGARLSPYTNLGGIVTFGSDGVAGGRDNGSDETTGYGPLVGLGLDFALGNRASFFLESEYALIFPDGAVDGQNPGASTGSGGDDTDFDVLGFYGGGLRFTFQGPGFIPARIEGLDCPSQLTVGETGSFMLMTNEDATMPVSTTWNWGDGMNGSGSTASHSYSQPGTYTVMAMAMNEGGEDSESCSVTVVERQIAPTLSACRVSPSSTDVGGEVMVNANVAGSEPTTISVDFGDGTMASALPARHTYSALGSYTVSITATNAYGSDTCTATVNVGDSYCSDITELNSVFFGFGQSALSADARERLNENIEILRRCPDICVTINGWTDDRESDEMRLSQRRADAVRDYYEANGIDASRLRAVGRGEDPAANSKEDPGPGDSRARRADSIPSSCAGF